MARVDALILVTVVWVAGYLNPQLVLILASAENPYEKEGTACECPKSGQHRETLRVIQSDAFEEVTPTKHRGQSLAEPDEEQENRKHHKPC